jgi:2-C-methyl-D-erythritol 4-phosphate cytidylyltransferase
MSSNIVHALIPAAGKGTRFGGDMLKQYLPIAGKPVISYAIRALKFHPLVESVTVVLAEDDKLFDTALGAMATTVTRVTGGERRAQSVRNGLHFLSRHYSDEDWVLVHDAARPCLSDSCLDRLLDKGMDSDDGAILAIPVSDTLKRANDHGAIKGTIDRTGLWAAQTPQLFRVGLLAKAIDEALASGCEVTDEASAMEFAGYRPRLILGSSANIKITHSSDLPIAEVLLDRRGQTA